METPKLGHHDMDRCLTIRMGLSLVHGGEEAGQMDGDRDEKEHQSAGTHGDREVYPKPKSIRAEHQSLYGQRDCQVIQ